MVTQPPLPQISVGIAGWSYPDWNGTVYPSGTKDKLAYAARFVDVIEVNASFYHVPAQKTVASWHTRTSDLPVRFTAKLNQQATHRGHVCPDEAHQFREAFAPLTETHRLSHLLAQFRYDFADTDDARSRILRICDAYTAVAPTLTLELRHRSWQHPAALAWLNRQSVSVANLDYPTARNSFDLPTCNVGQHAYLRLHGRNTRAWFSKAAGRDQTYDYRYTPKEIDQIADRAVRIADMSKTLTLIANNHFQGKEMAAALELKHKITGETVDVPKELLKHYPDLNDIKRIL
jgi:uncharacterized protein YecE (DUF72 family)